MENVTSNTVVTAVHSKAGELVILLVLTVALWFFMLGPGTDSYGLDYAYLLETGDATKFLLSDHLLWHSSCWAVLQVASLFMPVTSGLIIQQITNLILFLLALVALWFYVNHHRQRFWLTALGMLGAFASLKALVGGDVTAGPVLMITLSLFILPHSGHQRKTHWIILLLTIAPLFHKSLFVMSAGWWLAEVMFGDVQWSKSVVRATIITISSFFISLLLYWSIWFVVLSSRLDLNSWFFIHGGGTSSFFTLNILTILKGLLLALYRSFFSITLFKEYFLGNSWGLVGIGISMLAVMALLLLAFKLFLLGKKEKKQSDYNRKRILAIVISVLPSIIFFLFWIPGYYTYWTRFIPVIWVLFSFGLPDHKKWFWIQGIVVALLLMVNLPAQLNTKQGEEAGRFSRWLAPHLSEGDLIIMPGNGVFFFGIMPKYYYHVETATLDILEARGDAEVWLKEQAEKVWEQGHKVWLISDYAAWTSERLLRGEQTRYNKGFQVVKNVFDLAPKEEFHDPAMLEAWIAECLPRQ